MIGLQLGKKKTNLNNSSTIPQEFDLAKSDDNNEGKEEEIKETEGVIPQVTLIPTIVNQVTPTPVTGSETISMIPTISPTQIPTAIPTREVTPTLIPTSRPIQIPTPTTILPTATPTPVVINPSGVSLSATKAVLYIGDRQQILSKVEPDNASNKTVLWNSDNSNIAIVDETGLIIGVNPGETTITARTSNGKTNNVKVTVNSLQPEEEYQDDSPVMVEAAAINLNLKNVLLSTNKRQQILVNFIPNNVTDKAITWSSSNTNVATITNNGLITAKNSGTTTITAKTNNNKTATATITVSGGQVTSVPTRTPTTTNPNPTVRPTTVPTGVPTTPTATPTTVKKELKMAVMADIHNTTDKLKTMINRAKSRGSEIIVIAGDLTTGGTDSELSAIKKVTDKSEVRMAITQGNHDMRKGLFSKYFGPSYQSIKFGGIKLILIDNSNWKGLGDVQKRWIESEVVECKTIICVTIMHMPLNNPTSAHVMGESSKTTAAEADWLRKLLIENKVKETISGHIHHAYSYTLEGLKTTLVGSGGAGIYSEFIINDREITRTVISK